MCVASTTPSGGFQRVGPGYVPPGPPLPPTPSATEVVPAGSRNRLDSDLERQRRPLNPLGQTAQPRLGL